MRAAILGRLVFGAALSAAALAGGTVAAGDYPPDNTTGTTVSRGGTTTLPDQPDGELPATGSDAGKTMRIASGVVITGAGLLVVARRRRRPATS